MCLNEGEIIRGGWPTLSADVSVIKDLGDEIVMVVYIFLKT